MKTIGVLGGMGPQATMDFEARMRVQQVDGTILGCTEIPLLLLEQSQTPDLINPLQLLAEAAVREAVGASS